MKPGGILQRFGERQEQGYRLAVLALTIAAGLFGVWLLIGEAVSISLSRQQADAASAPSGAVRSLVETGTALAIGRKDLPEALVKIDMNRLAAASDDPQAIDIDAARRAATDGLGIAPLDSYLWLSLARLSVLQKRDDQQVRDILTMSYLTGPNNAGLMYPRLQLVFGLPTPPDGILRDAARRELRTLANLDEDFKARAADVYRHASDAGRDALRGLLDEVEPGLSRAVMDEAEQRG